ncbi:MAG: glycoside hydrolase family 15 protein [Deltaproteobacteria bacterium]|nr:glycoside hydrolase family 15 protein [Deltaproteobacteria bacterium]
MGKEDFPAIEDHGVIGDLRTVALVTLDGTIDYMCYPRFDSATVFGSLLDSEKGGSFSIHPKMDIVRKRQIYLPDTNILISRFLSSEGVAELSDFMPVDRSGKVIRRAKAVQGDIRFRLACSPRPDYGRATPKVDIYHDCAYFETSDLVFRVRTPVALTEKNGGVVADFTLEAGETAFFIFEEVEESGHGPEYDEQYVVQAFKDASNFWRDWVGRSTYKGRWREMVHRSALMLKLLTSQEYGSMVAAATFGLPEEIGGERNWDYRYTWIRDSAFTLYALLRLGFQEEALAFFGWLHDRTDTCKRDGAMQIMYGVNGRKDLSEKSLTHLAGYRNSIPVRVGNAAYEQLQLDIYGELLDAVYLVCRKTGEIYRDFWQQLTQTVEYVCENWREADQGIWEVRGGKRHFLSSRLMCWVALDRAVRMTHRLSLPAPLNRWRNIRNEIHESIYKDFWDGEQQTFVQHKGCHAIDGASMLMPLVKFISPTDSYWLSTMKQIKRRLLNDCLVYRYDNEEVPIDGLTGLEGAFTTCSFWYVECLARTGDVKQARLLFEKMLSYANHVGLYAEELSPTGGHLGNFPQALTHLSLISAAYALNEALEISLTPSRSFKDLFKNNG